jgi:hypothetical protein
MPHLSLVFETGVEQVIRSTRAPLVQGAFVVVASAYSSPNVHEQLVPGTRRLDLCASSRKAASSCRAHSRLRNHVLEQSKSKMSSTASTVVSNIASGPLWPLPFLLIFRQFLLQL